MELNNDKNLISLKEAAEISGYSSDYVGQLIRSGKIPGKQVYCNVAWMTTKEAVLEYKNKGKKNSDEKISLKDRISNKKRQIFMEFGIIRLFFKTFKGALPILLIVIISFLLFCLFIFYLIFDNSDSYKTETKIEQETKSVITY